MRVLRKTHLVLHLLRGMATIALRFGRATPAQRQEMTRRWTVRMLALCDMRLVVHNHAATLDARTLVIGNHISWIDIYVINAWRPTPFVSKAEVRQWPIVGWLAEKLDTVFIQREKRGDAKRIMHELAERLSGGELMCLFPEGTTSDGLGLLPFHANLFQAAVFAGCAVQPVCMMYEDAHGRQSVAPAYVGDMSLSESLDRVLNGGPLIAHLYVGEPIDAGGDRRELATRAQAAVAALLVSLQAKVGRPSEAELARLATDARTVPAPVDEEARGVPADTPADDLSSREG